MLTLELFTRKFFEENHDFLIENYPGLKVSRLLEECAPYLKPNEFFSPQKGEAVTRIFNKISQGVPLEYINQKKYFYNSEFLVTPDVLIPRSETEILVEQAVEELQAFDHPKFIDIGTGSGAIALSILQELKNPSTAFFADIDEKALKVAKKNAFTLGFTYNPKSSLQFIVADRLDIDEDDFDLIVSNPPYIMESEAIKFVHKNVHKYEPHLALYLSDEDYYQWFKTLFGQAFTKLKNGGIFLMEGSENHLNILGDIARDVGFMEIELKNDYSEKLRFLRMKKWIN